MPKGWLHNRYRYNKYSKSRKFPKRPGSESAAWDEDGHPNDNRELNRSLSIKPETIASFRKFITEQMANGNKPVSRHSQPTQKTDGSFEEDRRRFNRALEEEWRKHNEKQYFVPSLGDYFAEHNTPSPSPSPSPRLSPSPSPSPSESSKSSPSNNILLNSLLLEPNIRDETPNIHDKTPPIIGGKSRRVFRRKMTSRRRQRRSTRSKHKH